MAGPNTPYFYRSGGGSSSGASPGAIAYNGLVNSGFDYWQAGTSVTATNVGGASHTLNATSQVYGPDQWYVQNTLGGGTIAGVITLSQVAAVTNGSGFGASVKITTAPTGTGLQNGCELYQPLSNKASQMFYGQTASFNVLVKALGNVTQVGVQFYYKTSEAKLDTAIGSEVLTTVNSSTFSGCNIAGQALGTSQTAAGIVGVRIRPTAVSSGNLYDLNNGFVVEQAMMNLGTSAGTFTRQYNDPAQELMACQYFFKELNPLGINNARFCAGFVSTANATADWVFPLSPPMRIAPTAIAVSSVSHFSVNNASNNAAPTSFTIGTPTPILLHFTTGIGTYVGNSPVVLAASSASARVQVDARI